MILADKAFSSALITVVNQTDSAPVAGATVKLTNTTLSYDVTVTTDTYGQAFFPDVNTPLVAGDYDVEISATGFDTETETVNVAGDKLEENTFQLTPS